jgi:hypothetical protein
LAKFKGSISVPKNALMAAYASTVDVGVFPVGEAGKTTSSFLQAAKKRKDVTIVRHKNDLFIQQGFSYDLSLKFGFNENSGVNIL